MMKQNGRVAVVVLTYNGKQYLPDLFASLEKTVYAGEWELIVVDNASTDGTANFIDNFKFPISNFQLIRNPKNLGFAAGNNVGIRKALDDGEEYVVLLNQDTVVEPHWLTHFVAAAEKDKTIGAVQARLMLWDKKDVVNSLGNEIHFLGFGYSGGYGMTSPQPSPKRRGGKDNPLLAGEGEGEVAMNEITYASGAAVLYRARALQDVGIFDESLWMYHEDLDIGWRLWRAGWKSVLAPKAVVYHKYEFSRSITKYYHMERNRFLVLLENYSLRMLLFIAPAFLLMEFGLFLKAMISGWGRQKLRAYAFFLRPSTWRLVVSQRRAKQKTFRHPERELLRRFVGTIQFQDMQSPALTYIANPFFNVYWNIIQRTIIRNSLSS